jgi:hypothetical protein
MLGLADQNKEHLMRTLSNEEIGAVSGGAPFSLSNFFVSIKEILQAPLFFLVILDMYNLR